MTDSERTRKLCELPIKWREDPRGGYKAKYNEVNLHIIGSEFSNITLTVWNDFGEDTIFQSPPHISQAPAGIFWRWLRRLLGLQEPVYNLTPLQQADENVRKNLEILFESAREQMRPHLKSHEAYENYRESVKQSLYLKLIYGDEKVFERRFR